MSKYRCESCGATLSKKAKKRSVCTYCGSHQIGPAEKSAVTLQQSPLRKKSILISISLISLLTAVIAGFLLFRDRVSPDKTEATHSFEKIVISKNIGIDLVHGSAWHGMVEQLKKTGSQVALIDTTIQPATLKAIDVLIIHGRTGTAFDKNEIDAIVNFIKTGNILIAADQAWSWTYTQYGNKPLEEFPLNRLGEILGYQITGQNIYGPTHIEEDLKSFVHKIHRTNWAPSKIKFFNKNFKALIRDNGYQIMAGVTKFGKGTVFVCGHHAMLSENPRLLYYFLKY